MHERKSMQQESWMIEPVGFEQSDPPLDGIFDEAQFLDDAFGLLEDQPEKLKSHALPLDMGSVSGNMKLISSFFPLLSTYAFAQQTQSSDPVQSNPFMRSRTTPNNSTKTS